MKVRARGIDAPQSRHAGGGLRGKITSFTKQAAARMGERLAAINRAAVTRLPVFITLTYPAQFSADPRCWKRDLDAFLKRLMRQFDVYAVVWKLEPQMRGAPHYHLLVFGRQVIDRAWVSRSWWEIVGSKRIEHLHAGTRVESIRSWHGVMSYASKAYMSKAIDRLPDWWKNPGRFWGVRGKLPIDWREGRLSGDEFRLMVRLSRRWLRAKIGGQLRRRVRVFRGCGITVRMASDQAWRLLAWVQSGAGLTPL